MPTLRTYLPKGQPRLHSVNKPITTIGSSPSNDIVVQADGVAEAHAQIIFDGRFFNLEEVDRAADIQINGKKKRRARLSHNDRIHLGSAEIAFSLLGDPSFVLATEQETSSNTTDIAGLEQLNAFSERLMQRGSVDELLTDLLDAVVEISGAHRGAVLLVEPGEPSDTERRVSVRAVRNVRRDIIADASGGISDSIVRKVITTGMPVIVSDALADQQFGKSESVLALKLSSVMCVPMLAQGESLGALYVGNDHVKQLFDRSQLDLLTVFAAQASLILQNAMLLSSLRADKEKLQEELSDMRFGEIIGACDSMLEVFRKLQKVASTDISVLITGETGTGKELIAREIHRRSPRVRGPFVTINCGAIPENLIESELFGHVRGAFTGAVASRPGKFQVADKGTLFLDEIGELPLNLQVKLLRALQEHVVYRVGDSRPEKVDIRIVAATNRNLDEEIRENRFREDLYYRLNVVNLWLPPLRARGEDVVLIARALLSKYADELNSSVRGFAPDALTAIKRYAWPGNVRQLENRIKKALVLCDHNLLTADDLDLVREEQSPILPLERAKEEFQHRYVREVLERNNGNRTQTARDLGVDPRTIFRYLEREQNPIPSGGGKG
ncbi:MAG TPA: sigma 54-interacting transcriptional regulator [Polyangiaceae bacterium]|jgi:transcriptional regulator with GAF, ATPase, and Fis domain|nr:MAG: Nitrogen fixation protein VnfA [Deltaproteobacteria bacterium ADurb.Bin207]HNZ21745.1 sigma 54-interacting transcriptional regulator [Polyangiaceae bacterium]HOD21588.1 sigma 54-interacting transcriptional regulator [Polyangiaceae bacterium]HOE50766.1 sigma 54-interacting transcriptional regulator [Polyangiaceae bacterium]HOG99694.1 sigma 54-interacting transcriptional regulator [Polyangiaceae bacterium]